MNSLDPSQNSLHLQTQIQSQLQESEIKLAFLEKELGDYKDALHTLHLRLEAAERTLRKLQESGSNPSAEAGSSPTPFAS